MTIFPRLVVRIRLGRRQWRCTKIKLDEPQGFTKAGGHVGQVRVKGDVPSLHPICTVRGEYLKFAIHPRPEFL